MDLKQLRYFVTIAEERNMGRAALKLNISQPPLSRQIQSLEQRLDVQLFERTPKGMNLTEAGKVLFDDAQKLLAQANRIPERIREVVKGEIGQLNVAFFGSTVYHVVPSVIRAFTKANPGVAVSLVWMSKQQQVNALRDGNIHIGFGRYYDQDETIVEEILCRENFYAAVSSDTDIYNQDSVTVSELATLPVIIYPAHDSPSIADAAISMFRKKKVHFTVAQTVPDLSAALALVSCGNRCTIVTEAAAALCFPGLRFIPVSDSMTTVPTSYITLAKDHSQVLKTFLTLLQDPNHWNFATNETIEETADSLQ